jgi:putative transposase
MMKRMQAFKFLIKPNGEQRRMMAQYAGNARKVWNLALAQQQKNYAAGEKFVNAFGMNAWLVNWKKEFSFLRRSPAQTLQQVMTNVERAYKNFFEKRAEHPLFKKKGKSRDSFRFPDAKQFIVDEVNGRIKLPKLGWIRYRKSRLIIGNIKNITVSYSAGQWFMSIQTEREVIETMHSASSIIGIDMGVKRFATLSNGVVFEPVNALRSKAEKLAQYQRRCSRKIKFSKNWKKQKHKITRLHQKIANIRNDFLHKTSHDISKNHAIIVVEDLKVTNMSQSAAGTIEAPGRSVQAKSGLNKSILDQGWGEFRRQLEYKAAWMGGEVIAIHPKNTSRCCSACNHVSAENRKTQAEFECVVCGYAENADLNAALNILRAGHARIACEVNDVVKSSATGTRRSYLAHTGLEAVGILAL